MLGLLVVIPLCAVAVWWAALAGVGNRGATMIERLRMAVVFTGLAAVLTAGGVGRLAAQASIEKGGGRKRAARVAARTMAAGSAALTMIAAVPLGHLPARPWGWALIAVLGAIGGAAAGALIGVVCGGPMPSLTELGVFAPLEGPIEWTRDLLGLDEKDDDKDEKLPGPEAKAKNAEPEPEAMRAEVAPEPEATKAEVAPEVAPELADAKALEPEKREAKQPEPEAKKAEPEDAKALEADEPGLPPSPP